MPTEMFQNGQSVTVSVSDLPARFTVGVLYRSALSSGGTLVVDRGSLTLEPSRLAGRAARWVSGEALAEGPIMHARSTVTVLCSRIPTPVANTTVLIEPDGSNVYAASVPPWLRRHLLEALEAAGFAVCRETHWIANGFSRVR